MKAGKNIFSFDLIISLLCITITASCNIYPVVEILNPAPGSTFKTGSSVFFYATISNPDGDITKAEWISSIDGIIQTVSYEEKVSKTKVTFSTSDMSLGTHIVYFYAISENGLIGKDNTTIIIVDEENGGQEDEPFSVTITNPLDGDVFENSDFIALSGTSTDPEDGILTGSMLTWTSGLDGEIGTGNVVITNSLSEGTHFVVLNGTNSRGDRETDSITFTVVDLTSSDNTTTTIPDAGSDDTTTTTTVTDLCPTEEPFLCVDDDFDSSQYWCCDKEFPVCGKVEFVDGDPRGTCLQSFPLETTTIPIPNTTNI